MTPRPARRAPQRKAAPAKRHPIKAKSWPFSWLLFLLLQKTCHFDNKRTKNKNFFPKNPGRAGRWGRPAGRGSHPDVTSTSLGNSRTQL